MPVPALEVERLHKSFGGLVAARDLSFTASGGEIVGLIGPNGSGKTTVLNLISGALRPSSGEVRLRGERITGLPPFRICRLGVGRTFQLVRILPGMTVLENAMVGAMFGATRATQTSARLRATELLAEVGLGARKAMPAGKLTYVDQKRLEFVRVLAGDPHLLLLDEWLAGLNPTELVDGIDLIRRTRDRGITVVLVEHVMHAVRALCDRVIVMDAGIKVTEGRPHEVLADPEVIRAYLGDEDA
jgi:ABC-type branched-subunit amino acid transport system ATPase component